MKNSALDKALVALKKRIIADVSYDPNLKPEEILASFDFSDIDEMILPLYKAAREDAKALRS